MFFPMLIGFAVADLDIGGTSFEIRRFRNARHVEEITSAFQFELAPNETLHVSRFIRGALQGGMQLSVVIEGVESVDSFLLRFRGGHNEIDLSNNHIGARWSPPDTFLAYDIDIVQRDLLFRPNELFSYMFFYGEEYTNVELVLASGCTPVEFRNVYQILRKYHPAWIHPFFFVPVIIQAVIIIFVVVRVRKRG
jgi:hypothetical protein